MKPLCLQTRATAACDYDLRVSRVPLLPPLYCRPRFPLEDLHWPLCLWGMWLSVKLASPSFWSKYANGLGLRDGLGMGLHAKTIRSILPGTYPATVWPFHKRKYAKIGTKIMYAKLRTPKKVPLILGFRHSDRRTRGHNAFFLPLCVGTPLSPLVLAMHAPIIKALLYQSP